MSRHELIIERKDTLKDIEKMKKHIANLEAKLEATDDDDKYGCALMAARDELVDMEANLAYLNSELQHEQEQKNKGY